MNDNKTQSSTDEVMVEIYYKDNSIKTGWPDLKRPMITSDI